MGVANVTSVTVRLKLATTAKLAGRDELSTTDGTRVVFVECR